MKAKDGVVRVGKKPQTAYINASFYCLENFGHVKLRGLGRRQGKVLEIADAVSKVDGVEICSTSEIQIDDTGGVEVSIERIGGERNET